MVLTDKTLANSHMWSALTILAACFAGKLTALTGETANEPPSSHPIPLQRAHAHNDYQHSRPLLDALDCGFCSIEADVFLVDGELLVAHELVRTRPDRTLTALYLEPLRRRIAANGGRVYRNGPVCFLFIDLKTRAEPTYAALDRVLSNYADILTQYRDHQVITGAVSVIVSGNCPRAAIAAQSVRYAACDGRKSDFDSDAPAALVPVISERWGNFFTWRGSGQVPQKDGALLKQLLRKAHARSRLVRFWGAPDNPETWGALLDAGVDLINTDKLTGLRDFLCARQTSAMGSGPAPKIHETHPADILARCPIPRHVVLCDVSVQKGTRQ